jgi:hypothetical protein
MRVASRGPSGRVPSWVGPICKRPHWHERPCPKSSGCSAALLPRGRAQAQAGRRHNARARRGLGAVGVGRVGGLRLRLSGAVRARGCSAARGVRSGSDHLKATRKVTQWQWKQVRSGQVRSGQVRYVGSPRAEVLRLASGAPPGGHSRARPLVLRGRHPVWQAASSLPVHTAQGPVAHSLRRHCQGAFIGLRVLLRSLARALARSALPRAFRAIRSRVALYYDVARLLFARKGAIAKGNGPRPEGPTKWRQSIRRSRTLLVFRFHGGKEKYLHQETLADVAGAMNCEQREHCAGGLAEV